MAQARADCPNRQGGPLTLNALYAADGLVLAAKANADGREGVEGPIDHQAGMSGARASVPLPESELLHKLQAFAGVQDAVDELRRRGLLAKGADGVLTSTDAGQVTHDRAAAGVATVRSAVRGALPEDNCATLLRLLADPVDGLDRIAKASH